MVDEPRLRIHDTQEWYDLYQPVTNDELQKFFDRYTKGIENGWESTPKVRVSLLGYNEVCRASSSTLLIGIANMLYSAQHRQPRLPRLARSGHQTPYPLPHFVRH